MIFPPFANNMIIDKRGENMKRVLGIFGVVLICMLLGISVEWARDGELTLVSSSPAAIAGE